MENNTNIKDKITKQIYGCCSLQTMWFGSETKGRCGFCHLLLVSPTFTCDCAAGCLNTMSKIRCRAKMCPRLSDYLLSYISVYKSVIHLVGTPITLTEKSLLGVSRFGKWLKAYGLVQTG